MNNKQLIVTVIAIITFGTILALSNQRTYHRGEIVKSGYSHIEVGGYYDKQINVPFLFGGIAATTVIYAGTMYGFRSREAKPELANAQSNGDSKSAPAEPIAPATNPLVTPTPVLPPIVEDVPLTGFRTAAPDGAYQLIAKELKSGSVDDGLWTKAYADALGDENKTKALYIRYRAASLGETERGKAEKSA